MSDWTEIGCVADIPKRGARRVTTQSGAIAVFRTGEDEIFALEDRCPHKNGPLSQGIVHGKSVTCPLHTLVISLETGASEDEGCATTVPVRLEGERIFLQLTL
ncbi:nitrite reductase small subunit NirD [Roseiterribacter gracilis]|uniref:tRNA-(Guanine-N1)-methyltransferase n=1 Tax=Roseiterribacter gracilis TaxID=2812848 RepID=A0A8S8XJH0_9PROT|nr:tRNA-(guanine-N1)-methyltransferase [Rhodospirillales bacterium TMPK1]